MPLGAILHKSHIKRLLQLSCNSDRVRRMGENRLAGFMRHRKSLGTISIPAAVLLLSAIAHGLVLYLPFPFLSPSEELDTSESELSRSDDMQVVILPNQDDTATDNSEDASLASTEELLSELPENPVADSTLAETSGSPDSPLEPEIAEPPVVPTLPEEPVDLVEPIPTEPETPHPELSEGSEPEEDLPDEAPTPAFNEPDPTEPTGPLMAFEDGFPHPASAVGGCFGLSTCQQVSGQGSYRNVARSLKADLESQGYDVRERDDLEDTGRRVYELSPSEADGSTRYLMVFSNVDGSAIYVLSDEILNLRDLQALNAHTNLNNQAG